MSLPASVPYSPSLLSLLLSLILGFPYSFHSSSVLVFHSLINITPFHKHTASSPHQGWLLDSLSLISPLVQSYTCSPCPCSPPRHTDQSWVSWSSMTAFKAIPALLFKPWNIHCVQAPVHVYRMGVFCVCSLPYGNVGVLCVHVYGGRNYASSSVRIKNLFSRDVGQINRGRLCHVVSSSNDNIKPDIFLSKHLFVFL